MKKFKRTLSLLLCLIMVACLVPTTAFAEESEPTKYDVWVAGTQVTSANAGNILDGTATYDAATNTLTVNKDIETTDIWGAIEAETEEDFNLIIADGVKLKSESASCISAKNNLIINCGDLDIVYGVRGILSDNGSVSITGKEISVLSNGIGIYGDEITINCDKLSVETEGTTAGLASDGICGEGNVEITCNMLSVVSQSQNGIYSESGSVTIKGSESSEIVIAANGSSYGCGVWSYQDTTIKGGKLDIIAPQDGIRSRSGVELTAKECSINTVDCGIDANEDVTINCDKLSVITTEDDALIRAIISDHGDVTITGGENSEVMISSAYMAAIEATEGSVELTAKDISLTSAKDSAIYCSEDVTIDCDTAKITAEENGIETLEGSIIIKGGAFDIRSTETADYEMGWYALAFKEDFIYPAGATVTAATEVDGTFEAYDETKNATYDHVKIGTVSEVTPITTVEIDGVSAPQLNQTREAFWNKYNTELTDGTITLNEKTYVDGKFDNIIVVDGEFYHADKETVVDDSHVIAPGTYYNALALLPAEGFEFAEDITATVDGATATETEFLENGVLVIYAKYVLEAPAPVIPTEITEVDATVAEPVVGGTPSTVATTTGTDYTVFVSGWYDEEENTVSVFEAGKTYTLEVGFTPKEGYVLAGSKTLDATINDKEAEYLSLNTINGTVTCFIRYTIPAVVPTEININKLPSLTVGDNITKAMAKNVFPAGLMFINNTPYVAVINGVLIGQPTKAEADTNYYLYATWDLEDYTEIPDASQYVVKYNGTALTYTPNNLVKDNEQSGYYFFEANGNIYCRVWIYLGKAAPAQSPTEYNITVNGGTASVGAGTAVTKATAGTVITLTVDESAIPAGKVFDKWEVVSGGVTVADGKFTMPESAVEINATYKDAPVDPPFVDWIEISDVTAPVAGTDASIAPNYVVDSARNYTVEKAEWWMNDIDSKATEFVAGTNYRAVFTLVPKEGVVFDSPLKVKINGNDATVISSSEDKAVVSISLTAKSAPASHTCDIKPVAKDEPSCTEGGKEAYYKCDGCGKFYEDALGAKEITDLANWGNLPKLGHTESDWKSDKDNHWKECTVTACGVIIEDSKAAHKDDNKDGKCDVCEYNVGLPTTPDEDKPNDTPQTGDNSMIWLLIALLFVSGAGVVATTVYGKKKFSVK